MKPKRVLILTPFFSPNTGGVETHLDDLVDYLAKKGHMVYVLSYHPLMDDISALSFERKNNLEIRRIKWFKGLFNKLEPYPVLQFIYLVPRLFAAALWFMLRYGKDIDVVHAQGISAAFVARIIKVFFRKRTVVSTHAVYSWLYNVKSKSVFAAVLRWIFNGADKVLSLSQQSKKELIDIGVLSGKIDVYRYWVNQDLFRPLDKGACKEKLGWAGKPVVLFVGRMIKVKGALTLFDVAQECGDKQILFAFIGDGPLLAELKKTVKPESKVAFLGRVGNCDLPLYYNAADILAVPSQYEEGLGRVLFEALSCGTPVIAARRGGIPEVIDESVGILVEPDKKNIAETVRYLFNNSSKLKDLSEKCRAYAEKVCGISNAQVIENSYS